MVSLFSALEFLAAGETIQLHAQLQPQLTEQLLISFSDLRPKFLVLSISCSLFCTSSPMYFRLAFCRQFCALTENSRSSTARNRFSLSSAASASASFSAGFGPSRS